MVLWIVIGVALFSLVVLGLAVRPVLAAVPELHRAVRRLLLKQEALERLQVKAETLQERALGVAEQAGRAADQATAIRAGRP
ncbi:hypothetical protein J2S43_004207 [Catenuloplanes nepalensis]|uniref:Uncharacterized protein n=1 Tax=Catenuloplanes nepalensis TaxID=587533 RepID=A0ABT9MW81_9ACTN|nr:hypothetical protein [Catenuloplanes nepalensis]MDP9795695.1 hypothetical protein [Catenuloplanes nepalensis]